MKLEMGQIVAARYEVDELIGSGGMAFVYRAKDLKLDRYVTLKVMREEFTADEEFISRFNIEARAAASLSNPNIVSIFDVGQDFSIHYIALEYINGTNLKDLIYRKAPFDNENILGVAIQIAHGLADAHLHGIIHRDIKPQNILVTNDGSVKVTDFGIARATKTETLDGKPETMGSAHYFSPEQARGGFVDHKSDIYSLGIVMYEMATGKLPFDGDTVVTVALKHINDQMPDMVNINPDISESIVKIIRKATEKTSSKRYQSIEEMSADLRRALTNASGDFVVDEHEKAHNFPTRNISQSDRDEISRGSRRRAEDFDDGYEDEYDDDEYDYEYDDDYPLKNPLDKKGERKAIIAGIGAAVFCIVLITLGAFAVYNWQKPKRVNPPDVVGLTVEAAQALAGEAGLKVFVMHEVYTDAAEAGIIVEQNELPEDILIKGETIHVTVSRGSGLFTLPSVEMRSLEEALEILKDLDINILQEPYEDENYPAKNVVVRQDPLPFTQVQAGSQLILYISLGPNLGMVTVPRLLGRTEAQALQLIKDAGLVAGSFSAMESTTYASGTLCFQSIDAFERVERNTVINYAISTGASIPTETPATPTPEPVTVPATPTPEPGTNTPGPTEEPVLKRGTLNIELWDVPPETETVWLYVMKKEGNNPAETLLNDPNVHISRFPYPLSIEGTGIVDYIIYSIEDGLEIPRSLTSYNFDE